MATLEEKELKKLRRLDENKTCAECAEVGPQYVDLSHCTFVCTGCGGILREFNFRVKGISTSTFSTDEIRLLRDGGNASARATWESCLREEDRPVASARSAVRAFIRQKYVDRAFASARKKAVEEESDESSDSSEDRRRRAAKRKKKKKKKQQKESDEESDFDADFGAFEEAPAEEEDLFGGAFDKVLAVASVLPVVTATEASDDDDFGDFAASDAVAPMSASLEAPVPVSASLEAPVPRASDLEAPVPRTSDLSSTPPRRVSDLASAFAGDPFAGLTPAKKTNAPTLTLEATAASAEASATASGIPSPTAAAAVAVSPVASPTAAAAAASPPAAASPTAAAAPSRKALGLYGYPLNETQAVQFVTDLAHVEAELLRQHNLVLVPAAPAQEANPFDDF